MEIHLRMILIRSYRSRNSGPVPAHAEDKGFSLLSQRYLHFSAGPDAGDLQAHLPCFRLRKRGVERVGNRVRVRPI